MRPPLEVKISLKLACTHVACKKTDVKRANSIKTHSFQMPNEMASDRVESQ